MARNTITLEVRPRSFSIGTQTYPLGQIARIRVVEARKTWGLQMVLVVLVALAGPVTRFIGSENQDEELISVGETLTVLLGLVAVIGLFWLFLRMAYREYVLALETAGAQLGVLSSKSRQAIMELRQEIVGYIDDPPSTVIYRPLDNRVFNFFKGDQIIQSGGGNIGKLIK